MNTQAEDATLLTLPRGRKEQEPGVIELTPIRERLYELEQLYREGCDANEAFTEAVKETAEASGLLPGVLKKFVVARVKDQMKDRRHECEQLSFLFESIE